LTFLPLAGTSLSEATQVVTSHCLGSGSFATVNLAIDTQRYCQVACKTIKTKSESDMKKVQKEVQILMKLNHVRPVS
jgi:meiosis-specific serine/threonine-protein kinase MEK1